MAENRLFSSSCQAMGTSVEIHLYAAEENRAALYFEMAFDEIRRIDRTLSRYQNQSELVRINRLAAREAVTTDPEVFRFLQLAFDYSRRSGGAFDMTISPLLNLWGFSHGTMRVPSDDDLRKTRTAIGWQKVALDPASRTVRFTAPGVELDPGALGKGYAVDCVVSLLREERVTAALIDAGSSSVYGLGSPPGKPGWVVRVPRPGNPSHSLSTVSLCNNSLSTSGSYEKFFRWQGHTYCHILDPRTGMPVDGVLQTTVISPHASESEALSTIAFISGPQISAELLQQTIGASALWVLGQPESGDQIQTWNWPEPCSRETTCESSVQVRSPKAYKRA
jgi:FAD:protein FMN transferase